MDNDWMDLHGETPDDGITECYGCGHLLSDGECLNPECKLCERVFCSECHAVIDPQKSTEHEPGLYFCKNCSPDILCIECGAILPNHLSGCCRWTYDKNPFFSCENSIHYAEGGDLICPDCEKAV